MENETYTTIAVQVQQELAIQLDRVAARRSTSREAEVLKALRSHVEAYEPLRWPPPRLHDPGPEP